MTFDDFRRDVDVTLEGICRDFYNRHRDRVKIKKEHVAVRNLVTIVNTTLALSQEKGFDAMSLRDLVRESGLSMGALYSYFTSKEDLLTMIQDQGQQAVKRILLEQVEQETLPMDKLRRAVLSHLYLSEIMHRWFYFFFMETKNLDHRNRRIPIESELLTEKILTDILDEGVRDGSFDLEKVTLFGSVVKAMLQDWYLKRWKYRQRKISVEEYGEYVLNIIESFIVIISVIAGRYSCQISTGPLTCARGRSSTRKRSGLSLRISYPGCQARLP